MKQLGAGFRELLENMMRRRWFITAIVLFTFLVLTLGIVLSIHMEMEVGQEWKELLLLMLGAFIGSYGKIIDYWFSDTDKDKLLVQKMDEEDGATMSNVNDFKESDKEPTPIIPDAFVAAAQGARELTTVRNEQSYTLQRTEQEHRQQLEADQQEHEQELEELKLQHELKALKYCEHEWGSVDGEGQVECQKCGLFKDVWDDTH